MSDNDLPVWPSEALVEFARHPSPMVRFWALRRLAARRDPSHALTILSAFQHANKMETIELFEELFEDLAVTPLGEPERAALCALEAAHEANDPRAHFARKLLAHHGDEEAFARIVDHCRRRLATPSEWTLVRIRNPALARSILHDWGCLDDPTRAPPEALDALAWLCAPELLPRVHERAIVTDTNAPMVGDSVLARCRADNVAHLDAQRYTRARALAESMAARMANRRSAADRAFAARWETPEVLRPLADALVDTRWSEAAAWSRARLDELRRHDDASQSARAYAAWLTQQRKPNAIMVEHAVAMALASVDRALDTLKPFDRADLETRAWRTLTAATADAPVRDAWAAKAWSDPATRAVIEGAIARAFEGDDAVLRIRAARLCQHLPGIELPMSVARGTWQDPWADDALDCLASHPASLERIARENNAAAKPWMFVYEALARQHHRAVTPLLRDAVARLATLDEDTTDAVLHAVMEVRDPSLIPPLLDAYEPLRGIAGYALYVLALVAPEPEWRSPEVLEAIDCYERALEEAPLDRPRKPFVVCFVCDMCGEKGRVEVPTCYVRVEQAECRSAGWDGITFDRVITCPSCGAQDRYTLTPGTRWRALMSVEVEGDGIELVVGPLAVEGVKARRATDLLRHFTTALAASPDDLEARRKLAVAQAAVGRTEDARATLARAFETELTDLKTLVAYHEAALAVGDDDLVERAAQGILARLPSDESDEALRKDAAKRAATWLRKVGAVKVTWRSGNDVLSDAIDLERVTKWERFVSLLTERCVRTVVPTNERPPSGGRLEKALDGLLPLSIELAPPLPPSPKALAPQGPRFQDVGRNDPCPCGSGKKYKKCHLALR